MNKTNESIIELKKLPYLEKPFCSRGWGHKLHSLCSYQSKLKPGIAYFLANLFGENDDLIFDPFSGIGTIPFELAQKGIKTISLDINPIAYTVTLAKLKKQDKERILKQLEELNKFIKTSELTQQEYNFADDYTKRFYHEKTLREILLSIKFFTKKDDSYSFLKACLLHILHGNRPYALSRTSHNVTPYAPRGDFVYKDLVKNLKDKVERMFEDPLSPDFVEGEVFLGNIMEFSYPKKFDKIITSPPFINSTRFLYNNRIRMWFNGYSYQEQMKQADKYLESKGIDVFNDVLKKFSELLKQDGYCILHLGVVKKIDMGVEISKLGEKLGFKTLAILYENVSGKEKFGIRDQGATHKHQFLIMQKR
ncbi:DNA adenine methylase [Candidatus Woesearchaeota archaeon]|nr:DNA adenine methylase [Candidatus Woesearchaeota archaeon]